MRKKGILMQNALSLIIAVVGLALIFYAAYSLYFKLNSSEETESAKALIDVIEGKINAFEIGKSANVTIRGVNGESWQLAGFDLEDVNRPDACFFDPCIYICKRAGRSLKEDCMDEGFYRRIDFNKIIIKRAGIEEITQLGGGQNQVPVIMGYKKAEYEGIDLPNKLIEIQVETKIEDNKNILIITHLTDEYLKYKDQIK